MNVLPKHKREQLVSLLVEGNSLRGTSRIADVAYNTVLKFLPQLGHACAEYMDRSMRELSCRKLQIDEIWSFVHTKRHNLTDEKRALGTQGDFWTFVALDPETKLVPSWLVGPRTLLMANDFIRDLSSRLAGRVQISTDGFKAYLECVDQAFGNAVDYGMLVKVYADEKTDPETMLLHTEVGIKKHLLIGKPEEKHISTSLVERQNATMRQSMRRFTRRTMGFSKKAENHAHAVALHFLHYNFSRVHKTLRVTPAMAAGVSNHVWEIGEIVDLLTNV